MLWGNPTHGRQCLLETISDFVISVYFKNEIKQKKKQPRINIIITLVSGLEFLDNCEVFHFIGNKILWWFLCHHQLLISLDYLFQDLMWTSYVKLIVYRTGSVMNSRIMYRWNENFCLKNFSTPSKYSMK